MLDIIFNPVGAIHEARTHKAMGRSMLVLLVASVLAAVNVFAISKSFANIWIYAALGIFAGTFLITLLMARLLQTAIQVLAQKGSFYAGVTTLSYSTLIMSSAYLTTSLIGLIPSPHIAFAVVLKAISALVLLVLAVVAFAVMFKAGVELFHVDLFTIIVALLIVYLATFLTLYLAVIRTIFSALAPAAALGPVIL